MAATNAPVTRQQPSSWRLWVPWVLVVLAAVIGLVSALNIWVKRQALDTNNFTNASVQLLEDPAVRSAISIYLVDQLYQNVNVAAELEKELPPQIKGIAAPLAGALRQLLVRAADTLLSRPRVQQLWKQAVMRAHQLFIAVIDGKRQILQNTNGNVVLNLRPIVQELEKQGGLLGKVAAQLPPDAGQITIMKGNQLKTARTAVKAIRFLSYFLFFLVIAIYALAVYLATGRRRQVLMGVGVSAFVVGLIVLVVRRFAGNYLIDALTKNPISKPASASTSSSTGSSSSSRRGSQARRGRRAGSGACSRRRRATTRGSSTASWRSSCCSSSSPARPTASACTRSSSCSCSRSSASRCSGDRCSANSPRHSRAPDSGVALPPVAALLAFSVLTIGGGA